MSNRNHFSQHEKNAPSEKPEAPESIGFTPESVPPEGASAEGFNAENFFGRRALIDVGDGNQRFTTSYGQTFLTGPGGVFLIETRDGQENEKPICGPLSVVGDIENEEGAGQRRLVRWIDDEGREHKHVFRRDELAANPKEILRVLMDAGLELRHAVNAQGTSGWIQNYLLQYPKSEKITGRDRLGWWEIGKCFALPGGVVVGTPSRPMIFTGNPEDEPHYGRKGTLDDWQSTIGKDATHSRRIMFALCVAVTPPLMAFCKEENGGFHFYGASSKGKSTLARALCSVWGPAEDGEDNEMASWENTPNGIEAFAASHHNLPMVLDEISRCDPGKIVDILYKLGNGVGKGRMNRNLRRAKPLTWQTMFLSTGERTTDEQAALASRNGHTVVQDGALIRMANIPAIVSADLGVFDELPEGVKVQELAQRINLTAKAEAYGTAGPAFIQAVIDEVEQLHGVEEFRKKLAESREKWVREHCETDDSKILRVAYRFALVAAAGELAIIKGVFPWRAGEANKAAADCFTEWVRNFQTDDQKEAEVLSKLDDFITANFDNFDRVREGTSLKIEHAAGRTFYGYLLTTCADTEAYIIPTELSKVFCRPAGLTLKQVCEVLGEHGRLRTNDKKKGVLKPKSGNWVHALVPMRRAVVVLQAPSPEV